MILTKPKLISQERLDLEDLLVLFAGISADSKFHTKQFWGSTQYILKGFAVSGLGGPSPATVNMTDATLINPNNTGDFSWFSAESAASPVSVPLNANARNYLELALSTVDGTPLTRAFWDPSASGGLGAEFNQTINTVTNIAISVVALTGGFSGSANRIPLAIVDTDSGNNIKLILDKRPMFFRLGTPADPLASYAWASNSEPELTLNLSGVSGTFTVGETVTIGAVTAKVTTGGTSIIGVILPSTDSIAAGATVTGGTSGATGTLTSGAASFVGADKSIGSVRDALTALMTEIRRLKGTSFWFETGFGSVNGLMNFMNSVIVPNSSGAKVSWNGSALSISDSSGAPADSDVVALIRIFGSAQVLNLTREDGTGGSSALSLADGEVLYVTLPATGNQTYSAAGSGATNYKKVARASFVVSDTNYWIAYREGSRLFFRGVGELQTDESSEIGDNVPQTLLNNLGLTNETSAPGYSSDIRGTAAQSLVARIGALTDAIGDQQEDRSSYLRSDNPITWTGTQLQFTTDIVLEMVNTKSGTLTAHTIAMAGSPISLNDGESLYVAIDRTASSETVTPVRSSVTPIPAQSQANKDIFVIARRKDANGAGYLHIPLHKQVLNPGQTVRLGASGSGSGTGGAGDDITSLSYSMDFQDQFDSIPDSSAPVDISAGKTDSTLYSVVNGYYRLAYDASKTCTGTTTSMVLSGTPGFTVKAGDILRVGTEARRITAIGSINSDGGSGTPFTIESAFAANPSAASACVSQAVYTKDLNAFAGDGLAPGAVNTNALTDCMVTYEDTAGSGDEIFDNGVSALVAFTASADGSTYCGVQTRPSGYTGQVGVTSFPVSGTNLYLRFFANASAGSGSINLLGYKVYFQRDSVTASGNVLDQAFAMTDGSATPVNCTLSVVGGKTRISLGFSYAPGLFSGKPNGQIEVILNGQKLPRFISGTATPDGYFKEINETLIELDSDYSAMNLSLEVLKRTGVVDSSDSNAANIALLMANMRNNLIYNPEGYVMQRISAAGGAVSSTNYGADRWKILCSANDVTVSRIASSLTGTKTAIRLLKSTSAGFLGMSQILENDETIPLQGQVIRFALSAKTESSTISQARIAVVAWTGTADSVTAAMVSSWAATPTYAASFTEVASATLNLTNSWQEVSLSCTVPASATNLIFFVHTPNSESVNDVLSVTAVRANVGSTAIPYLRRKNQEELAMCQRYYEKSYEWDVVPGTATVAGATLVRIIADSGLPSDINYGTSFFKVSKRVDPTVRSYGLSGNADRVSNGYSSADEPANSAGIHYKNSHSFSLRNGGATITTNYASISWQWTADAEL